MINRIDRSSTRLWTFPGPLLFVVVIALGCSRSSAVTTTADAQPISASPADAAVSTQVGLPIQLEEGHAPFYGAITKLTKDPHAVAPVSESDYALNDVRYTQYRYGHAPLGIPIDNIDLIVRKANHAAWSFVIHPTDVPSGLRVDDFAPPGGTKFLTTDSKANAESADEALASATLDYSVTKGPLVGCVLILRGDKTFALESHAEAYPAK